jgi:hypothetical protein
MEACYGHYDELLEAGSAYLKGKISRGVFEETANRILSFIRIGWKDFKDISLPPDLNSKLLKEIAKAEKGFVLFAQGVEKMRKVADQEKPQEEIFWQGLVLAKWGCDLLNEFIKNNDL